MRLRTYIMVATLLAGACSPAVADLTTTTTTTTTTPQRGGAMVFPLPPPTYDLDLTLPGRSAGGDECTPRPEVDGPDDLPGPHLDRHLDATVWC